MMSIQRLGLNLVVTVALLSAGEMLAQETRQVTVEALMYDLKHPDQKRRREAAILLGRNRVQVAVAALIEASRDTDPDVRLEAVRALLQIGDPRALPAYIERVGDPSRKVQEKAVDGIVESYVHSELGFVGRVRQVAEMVNPFADDFNPVAVEPYVEVDPRAVEALSRLLAGSDHAALRRQAAEALGILRAESALATLQERLGREENSGVRVEIVRAIYKIGDREAASSLIPLIRDPDKKVHDEAIYAVGRLRVEGAVEPLLALYDEGVEERRKVLKIVPVSGSDDLTRNVYQALSYIGAPQARELYRNGLVDEREFYRRYGAEGLARLGDASLVSEVARAYVRETAVAVRLAMSFALMRMGREEHLDELILNIGRDQVLHYLLELKPEETARLYPYLEREKDAITIRLLEVVGQRGDQSAVPYVTVLSASENSELVAAANLALRRLNGRVAQGG